MIPEGAKREAELIFLHDVVRKIEDNNIPASLVLNLDQTPSKYIQSSRYTMEKEGTKSIPIFGSSDKRSITATFVITLHGSFLPMQLIYGGKTSKSLPSVEFPNGFSLSANINHYSNSEESIKVIKEIVIPYVEKSRKNLNLATNFPALLIMDVFRGQMTTAVLNLLKANNILLVKVPNNMTHIFQPLDLTVNSWAKDFMREKFATWYAGKIKENLDKGEQLENIDIKTPLSVMKPLHATWLIELYNALTSEKGKSVVVNGWKASGIYDAVEMGLSKLPSLDPFSEIDQLNIPPSDSYKGEFPQPNDPNVNLHDYSDDEEEYELIEDGNAFENVFDITVDSL